MENQEYLDAFERILDWMTVALDNVKQCLFSHDKQCLSGAQNEFKQMLVAALPLINRIIAQGEKNELEKKLLMLVPSLQKIAQAMETILVRTKTKCDSAILLTERGMGELTQVISSVKELTRDTRDVFATGNPNLRKHARAEMEKITKMADDFALEHQQRLIIGVCTPQGSYLYVDMMDAFKRIARELAYLAEKG
jgi:Na+/phosphate symporter